LQSFVTPKLDMCLLFKFLFKILNLFVSKLIINYYTNKHTVGSETIVVIIYKFYVRKIL